MKKYLYLFLFSSFIFSNLTYGKEQSSIEKLQSAFHQTHSEAVQKHAEYISSHYPIITQDLLSMSLHLPSGEKALRFKMNKTVFMDMATLAHPPLTLFDLIGKNHFDTPLSKAREEALKTYDQILNLARAEYNQEGRLNKEETNLMNHIYKTTHDYIQTSIKSGQTSSTLFERYLESVTPSVNRTLDIATLDLLSQFKNQIYAWRTQYPNENWHELRVAILGFHQPRRGYALSQFFKKLLKEPGYERKVVYAEFQASLYPTQKTKALELAKLLIAKSDYDQITSDFLYHDPDVLEVDVMAKSATKILDGWILNWD